MGMKTDTVRSQSLAVFVFEQVEVPVEDGDECLVRDCVFEALLLGSLRVRSSSFEPPLPSGMSPGGGPGIGPPGRGVPVFGDGGFQPGRSPHDSPPFLSLHSIGTMQSLFLSHGPLSHFQTLVGLSPDLGRRVYAALYVTRVLVPDLVAMTT